MANVITQETFDIVVSENISDFDMEEDEAVKDAISQFEAQGIKLINIIKQPRKPYGEKCELLHEAQCVVEDLKIISPNISASTIKTIIEKCNNLKIVCDRSLPERFLAGKSGALQILNKLFKIITLEQVPNKGAKISILEGIVSLTYQYPDLLDEELIQNIFKIIDDENQDLQSLLLALVILRQCCTLHEANRDIIFNKKVFSILRKVIICQSDNEYLPVIKESCLVISSLTLDDDPRVLAGQANERIRIMVTDDEALKFLITLSEKYNEENNILSIIFDTLSRLLCRDEYCIKVMEHGLVQQLVNLLSNNIKDQMLLRSILILLKTIAGSDPVKKDFMSKGGGLILLEVVNENIKSVSTCENACLSIGALVLRHPDHAQMFMDSDGAVILTRVLQIHSNSVPVLRSVSVAIRNIVSRNPEFIPSFLETGIEDLLNECMKNYPSVAEELKAALRDLQCKVDLKESWKGTGFEIPQD